MPEVKLSAPRAGLPGHLPVDKIDAFNCPGRWREYIRIPPLFEYPFTF